MLIKKHLILISIFSFLMSTCVLAEPYATLETDPGNINIVGFTTAEDNGTPCFVALLEYENKEEESKSPLFEFSINAYQDGLQLETGYIYDFSFEDYRDINTKIRPGAVLKFYKIFELTGNGPVDLEVAPMFNFDHVFAEYTFDLSEELIPERRTSDASEEGGSSTVGEKIAELEARIAELEQRVSELENQ